MRPANSVPSSLWLHSGIQVRNTIIVTGGMIAWSWSARQPMQPPVFLIHRSSMLSLVRNSVILQCFDAARWLTWRASGQWVSEQSLTPHPTHNRSFRRRSSQPIAWLILTNKAVQENKHTETKYKSDKVNNLKKTAKQNYPGGSVASYDTWPGNEVGLFYNDNTHGPRNPHGAGASGL